MVLIGLSDSRLDCSPVAAGPTVASSTGSRACSTPRRSTSTTRRSTRSARASIGAIISQLRAAGPTYRPGASAPRRRAPPRRAEKSPPATLPARLRARHPCPAARSEPGRPSKWGNPFQIGRDGTRAQVIARYERWISTQPELLAALPELAGKTLGCWCALQACHGEVLARPASEPGHGA